MALHDRIRKLTYEDYVLIPDDGQRHEIIDGEHYVTPSPVKIHQRLAFKLTLEVGGYVEAHGLGELYFAPFDTVFSDYDIVQPDLLYVSRERAAILTRSNVQGSPDLVVEILSPSTRKHDQETKLALYDRFDVLEYWIFDPEQRTSQVYRRTEDGLRLFAELSAAARDVLTSPLLPGFSLLLAKIFAP